MRIIMTELNQQNVGPGLQRLASEAFVDKCFRAPSALGEIDHVYCVLKVVLDVLPPATAGMFEGIFTNSGITNDCQT